MVRKLKLVVAPLVLIIIIYFILITKIAYDDTKDLQEYDSQIAQKLDEAEPEEYDLKKDEKKDAQEQDNICDPNKQTLLTLFTTFYDVNSRRQIHNNTFQNWAALGPHVRALVYLNSSQENSQLSKFARGLGWCVEPVPLYRHQLPVIRGMFMDATTKYASKFYAYSNSDIMFDSTLVNTLKAVAEKPYEKQYSKNGILIVGKRINVNMEHIQSISEPSDIINLKRKGEAFLSVAQDYFITTKNGLPWQRVPDLVVGRPGYDNYFVIKSLDWKMTVIDATDTLTAIHQTGNDGNQSSFKTGNRCVNKNLIYPFDYTRGSVLCAPYFTMITMNGNIVIGARPWFPPKCLSKDQKIWECKERNA